MSIDIIAAAGGGFLVGLIVMAIYYLEAVTDLIEDNDTLREQLGEPVEF